jgi:toxic protein SymE
MTMANSRKLKIHTKHQARAFGGTTIPEIRLEGKWLDKLGFKEGQMVSIEQKKNKLTITIDKGQKQPCLQ